MNGGARSSSMKSIESSMIALSVSLSSYLTGNKGIDENIKVASNENYDTKSSLREEEVSTGQARTFKEKKRNSMSSSSTRNHNKSIGDEEVKAVIISRKRTTSGNHQHSSSIKTDAP